MLQDTGTIMGPVTGVRCMVQGNFWTIRVALQRTSSSRGQDKQLPFPPSDHPLETLFAVFIPKHQGKESKEKNCSISNWHAPCGFDGSLVSVCTKRWLQTLVWFVIAKLSQRMLITHFFLNSSFLGNEKKQSYIALTLYTWGRDSDSLISYPLFLETKLFFYMSLCRHNQNVQKL